MSALKSQMFLQTKQEIFTLREKVVDKQVYLCLNVNNTDKDFDGKFILSKVQSREPVGGVNRRGSKG